MNGFAVLGGVGWMFEFLGLAVGFGLTVVGFRSFLCICDLGVAILVVVLLLCGFGLLVFVWFWQCTGLRVFWVLVDLPVFWVLVLWFAIAASRFGLLCELAGLAGLEMVDFLGFWI